VSKIYFEIKNVTKRFGGLVANKNISIQIEEKGQIIGLIGPNGSGKSTLFKSINGFNRIDEGEIYFKDVPISRLKTYKICRMGITCTFQHAQLFSTLTLEESVLMGAYCHQKRKKEGLKIAAEMLEFVGLSEKKAFLISKINMYERKKVELAVALVAQPELLLLDELFAGLLPTEVVEMVDLVRKINTKYGITLLIIEHVLKVIMSLCEKVYVLEYGELIASGTPDEITKNEKVIKAYLGEDYSAAGD
jgi:branched-chain amino acid transport system ATP-binding protein